MIANPAGISGRAGASDIPMSGVEMEAIGATRERGPESDAPARPVPDASRVPGRFTQGPTMRHVLVMSLTGGVGLIAIFLVDFLSLMYVSWLGSTEKTAAVSFASIVLFALISVNIALMIAISATVSRALGAGRRDDARRLAGSGVMIAAIASVATAILALVFLDPLLALLGAKGETAQLARFYLLIALPTNPILAVGMAFSAVLRAAGDAKRAMWVTLSGGIATAIFDPILIFGLKLDIMGAALSFLLSRIIYVAIGHHAAVRRHDLVARPNLATLATDVRPIAGIALPATLTNLSTPVANGFIAAMMARYGVAAVAAFGVLDRIVPLAFGGLFALAAAIGPVLGQNWGARLFPRMRRVLNDAAICTLVYVGAMWLLLMLGRDAVVAIFHLSGEAADIVRFYCLVSGPGWMCLGLLFSANSAFNNLGFPLLATLFNWARATLGTIPVAMLGAALAGPEGVIAATLAASSIFGIGAMLTAHASIARLAKAG
jgi:putative MATE family efflux protein